MIGRFKQLKFIIFLFPMICYSGSLVITESGEKPLSRVSNSSYDELFFKENKKIYIFKESNQSKFEWKDQGDIKFSVRDIKGYAVAGYAVASKGKCQYFSIIFKPDAERMISFTFEDNKFIWQEDRSTISNYNESVFDNDQNVACYKDLLIRLKYHKQ
jgi:hypothetical protein